MMLKFVPNTAFQELIRQIKGQGLSLMEIQKRVEKECPGADVTFQDICTELLEQSIKSPKKQEPKLQRVEASFACRFSQSSESKTVVEHPFFLQLRDIDELKKPSFKVLAAHPCHCRWSSPTSVSSGKFSCQNASKEGL